MTDFLLAILLGIIEGLTEFIPVSSTGHLILASSVLNFSPAAENSFEIFIQLGAICAVVFLYWNNFKLGFEKDKFLNFYGKLLIAALPALIFGALFYSKIKYYLFNNITIALSLIIGGIIMIWAEKNYFSSERKEVSWRDAVLIGCFQIFSMCPGVLHRYLFGSTIVGGIISGLGRKTAADFSFMLSVPVITAATLYDLYKNFDHLIGTQIIIFLLGFLSAFIASIIAIRFFIKILSTWTLVPFAYYRIVLGIIVLLFTVLTNGPA